MAEKQKQQKKPGVGYVVPPPSGGPRFMHASSDWHAWLRACYDAASGKLSGVAEAIRDQARAVFPASWSSGDWTGEPTSEEHMGAYSAVDRKVFKAYLAIMREIGPDWGMASNPGPFSKGRGRSYWVTLAEAMHEIYRGGWAQAILHDAWVFYAIDRQLGEPMRTEYLEQVNAALKKVGAKPIEEAPPVTPEPPATEERGFSLGALRLIFPDVGEERILQAWELGRPFKMDEVTQKFYTARDLARAAAPSGEELATLTELDLTQDLNAVNPRGFGSSLLRRLAKWASPKLVELAHAVIDALVARVQHGDAQASRALAEVESKVVGARALEPTSGSWGWEREPEPDFADLVHAAVISKDRADLDKILARHIRVCANSRDAAITCFSAYVHLSDAHHKWKKGLPEGDYEAALFLPETNAAVWEPSNVD